MECGCVELKIEAPIKKGRTTNFVERGWQEAQRRLGSGQSTNAGICGRSRQRQSGGGREIYSLVLVLGVSEPSIVIVKRMSDLYVD